VNVTLVNPPYTFWRPGAEPLGALLGHSPPLGLLSLAAYVREHVPEAVLKIIDAPAHDLSCEATVGRVVESVPDVVGITMTTTAAPNAEAIALAVKARCPQAIVVVGGPHVSGAGQAALPPSGAFDLAVVGEGEETFRDLLERLRDGRPTADTPGILFRDAEGVVRSTPRRPPVADLDSLPPPAFDLLAGFPRAYPPNAFFSPGEPAGTLSTSRGCPFRCAFCDQSTFGHTFRALSPATIAAAIERLRADYGIRYLIFYDDTFTLDRRRVLELCELLGDLPRRIPWSCDANVATVDPEMLQAMKRAGCWSISYGLESGSRRVLQSLNKGIDPDRAREVVHATRAAGIRARGLFIFGTPEESAESVRETRAFMRSLPLTTANISKFTPYPGSELHAQVAHLLNGQAEQLNGMNFVVPSKHLSLEELEREYYLTVRHFYARLGTCLTHLSIMFGRWRKARRVLAAVPGLVRAGCRAHRHHSRGVS